MEIFCTNDKINDLCVREREREREIILELMNSVC